MVASASHKNLCNVINSPLNQITLYHESIMLYAANQSLNPAESITPCRCRCSLSKPTQTEACQ